MEVSRKDGMRNDGEPDYHTSVQAMAKRARLPTLALLRAIDWRRMSLCKTAPNALSQPKSGVSILLANSISVQESQAGSLSHLESL
jgi:hypothetical protein